MSWYRSAGVKANAFLRHKLAQEESFASSRTKTKVTGLPPLRENFVSNSSTRSALTTDPSNATRVGALHPCRPLPGSNSPALEHDPTASLSRTIHVRRNRNVLRASYPREAPDNNIRDAGRAGIFGAVAALLAVAALHLEGVVVAVDRHAVPHDVPDRCCAVRGAGRVHLDPRGFGGGFHHRVGEVDVLDCVVGAGARAEAADAQSVAACAGDPVDVDVRGARLDCDAVIWENQWIAILNDEMLSSLDSLCRLAGLLKGLSYHHSIPLR